MTVSTQSRRVEYNETGSTGPFAFAFRILSAEEMIVDRINTDGTIDTLTLTTDYTISGTEDDHGGYLSGDVTLTAAGVDGARLRLTGNTTRSQPTDYTPGDTFPAETHERALDRATCIIQELLVEIDSAIARSIRVPDGETVAELDAAADREETFIGFDENGDLVLLTYAQVASLFANGSVDLGTRVDDLDADVAAIEAAATALTDRVAALEGYLGYRYAGFVVSNDDLQDGDVVLDFHVDTAHTLQANFGSCLEISVGTNPTGTWTAFVYQTTAGVATQIGTIEISAAGAVTLTTVGGTAKPVAVDDIISVISQTDDATIARLRMTFRGVLG